MTKVKHAVSSRRRRKRTLKAVRGQRGARSKLLRIAKGAERTSLISNYIDRKKKKGEFRSLWITRIAAACRQEGVSYGRFIAGLKKHKIELNRKVLADIAAFDTNAFKAIVKKSAA